MRKLFLGKIIFVGVVIFFVSFSIASAQEVPDIKIKIGSFDKSGFNVPQVQACGAGENIKCLNIGWIGQYISAIFTYGISLAIALSVVMIMVGGLIWLMSGGRQDQVGRAKEFITGALSGLFLALFSVILLQVVNPGLINFEPLSIIQTEEPESDAGVATDSQESQTELIWSLNEMFGSETPDDFQISINSEQFTFEEVLNVRTINRNPSIYDIDVSDFDEEQIVNLWNYLENLRSFGVIPSTDLHSLYIYPAADLNTQAVQDLLNNNPPPRR